ncbi:hypothetical protein NL676_018329 [Syzygium grande]|nr:hypothetical protein NL676_018329 [Syzygium grande]
MQMMTTSTWILRLGLAISEISVSQLPGVPSAVWTVKKNVIDKFDAYIVVSFANATLVLSIGETVEEVSDSGFLDTTPSLAVSLIGDDSLMQVHPSGIRHIREDGRINEWRTPGKRTIVKVGSNRLQVVVALSGGELIYFEVDIIGQLMEVEKHEMSGDVACLDIAPASIGGEDGADHPASLFLNAGLSNGVLFRTVVDMVTGQQSNSRSRFLGLRAPKLFSIVIRGRRAMLCLCGCGRCGTIERLGETFNETAIPLRYTPRKIVFPERKSLIIIESDPGAFTAEEHEAGKKEFFEAAGMGENGNNDGEQMENGGDDEDKNDPLSDEQYSYPKAESDKWVSCIRVLDPKTSITTCLLELQGNEAAYSACTVNFREKEYRTLLAVWFVDDGRALELLHKTQVEGVPLALCQFQGRLLAGIGPVLRLYDLGKRRLLRKCENKLLPNRIMSIQTYCDRIYGGDIQEKASLIPGGGDSVIHGTVMGCLGALLLFTSRDDVDFFSHLEMHLRQEFLPLCGRDHMAYRSAYFPVKVSAAAYSCN